MSTKYCKTKRKYTHLYEEKSNPAGKVCKEPAIPLNSLQDRHTTCKIGKNIRTLTAQQKTETNSRKPQAQPPKIRGLAKNNNKTDKHTKKIKSSRNKRTTHNSKSAAKRRPAAPPNKLPPSPSHNL